MRTEASASESSSRAAAEGSVKPLRSSLMKVLLLRPGTVIPPPPAYVAFAATGRAGPERA
ncbi:hypothetical protein GCM10017778_41250 [Streptomyces vinaceus]|nr:hypothetical protein GCM10017778_41250 [Streptomyces vinaceus]